MSSSTGLMLQIKGNDRYRQYYGQETAIFRKRSRQLSLSLQRVESLHKCRRQDLYYIKHVLPYFIPSNLIFVCMRSVCMYNKRSIVHNMKLQNENLLSIVSHECSALTVSMVQFICHLRKENSFLNIFQKAPYITKLYIFQALYRNKHFPLESILHSLF